MIFPAARVMFLTLLRDRGALAMAFVLPPLIFVIFAAIFSSAGGDQLRLHVGIADQARTPTTTQLVQVLRQEPTLRVTHSDDASAESVRGLVKDGAVDLGLILRSDLNERGAGAPVLLVTHEARAIPGSIMAGPLPRLLGGPMPGVGLPRGPGQVEGPRAIPSQERTWSQ